MVRKLLCAARATIKRLLRPIYCSYTGYIMFDLAQRLTGYKKERMRFFTSLGYCPDLKNPQSFNEKVLWKKIYDKNPLLPIVSDKYRVRDYIRDVLGEKEAEKILVPLLYATANPESIPFDTLPEEYIIKPNHACEMSIFAEDVEQQRRYTIIDGHNTATLFDCKAARDEIVRVCKSWLLTPYGFSQHEWAYQKIKRKIVIEKLLRDSEGKIPDDYMIFIFHEKCQLIQVFYDKFIGKSLSFYTPGWKYINVRGRTRQADCKKKPENLKSMIDIAELLAKPFDFIRVDLYLIDNRIYFGELTNYPTSGLLKYNPASFDFELGSKWKLVPGYWK